MKNYETEIYKYRLPLVRPLRLKGEVIEERVGLIVRLRGPDGMEGLGEAAPLPGFSSESVDEAAIFLERVFRADEKKTQINILMEMFNAGVTSAFVAFNSALESLMLNDLSGYYQYIRKRDVVAINGLVTLDGNDFEGELARFRDQGYKVVKCKVGRVEMATELERLRRLVEVLGEDVKIRLDANRAWDLDTAARFLAQIEGLPVDYVEEPLRNPEDNVSLRSQCAFRLAADETLAEQLKNEDEENPLPKWAEVILLKPTLLLEAQTLAEEALEQGVTPVISACFESGVGITMLACLAASLETDVAVGLDTYSWLAEDVLQERLSFEGGQLDLRAAVKCLKSIDWDRMELVYRG